MATIVKRLTKGSPLTATEHDNNLENLNNDKAEAGANSDITSLTGLTTPLSIAQGGTASATASAARTALGLGTAAVLNTGVADGNVIVADATGLPTIDGSQLTNVGGVMSYANATTSTTLAVNTKYNDSSGTNTHTLPLLSSTTAGDEIKIFLTGTDRTVIVNHHASDSGGAEKWTGVAVGDFVTLISTGSAWVVEEHYESHYCRVYVSADEAVAQGASEHITTIAETTDLGGIWNTTNDEVDIPFDCWIDLNWSPISKANNGVIAEAKLDTTYIRDASAAVGAGPDGLGCVPLIGRFSADSGEKLELWATCTDNNSGGSTILGDAAGDESFATIKLTRRYS